MPRIKMSLVSCLVLASLADLVASHRVLEKQPFRDLFQVNQTGGEDLDIGNPTTSPTYSPTFSPTFAPTEAPTELPTESPTATLVEEENDLTETFFVILGITGIVLFLGVVVFFGVQNALNRGPASGSSHSRKGDAAAGMPIYAAPLKHNRDSMSTLYSRDRWSTISGGPSEDTFKIEAVEGKDNNLMDLLRDKRHEHNIKMSERPKNVPVPNVGAQKRQFLSDANSMREMEAGKIDESDL